MMVDVADLMASGALLANVPLGPMTTYKAGGPARYLAEPPDRAALEALVRTGIATEMPVLVIGRGSNLVVSDAGFPGVVIRLGEGFQVVRFEGEAVVAGAAVPLPRLARAAVDRGLTGLEFFVGIPGSVGGAVRQNAGCFGEETRDRLVAAEVVDLRSGDTSRRGPEDLELSYRHSNLEPHELVVEASFDAMRGELEAARERMRAITRWRKENQPGGTLNAGSVFKNPEGVTAGELIDSLGLKGLRVGEVAVSERHANFFVAGPGARADDVRELMELVKDRVLEMSGTMLEPEIQFVGFEP